MMKQMYHNNTGISDAINRRRAKYAKEQLEHNSRDRHGFIDLTDIQSIPQSNNKSLRSTIGGSDNRLTFDIIQEDKGFASLTSTARMKEEYEKYDPEPDEDERLINSGATIINSTIELTDSSGHNRTIVRRNNTE